MPAFTLLLHQMRPPQQPQVLGNRGSGNRKRLRNPPRRLPAPSQKIQNRPARGIGQSAEYVTDRFRIMRNYTVT